jgi:hypothetical protein
LLEPEDDVEVDLDPELVEVVLGLVVEVVVVVVFEVVVVGAGAGLVVANLLSLESSSISMNSMVTSLEFKEAMTGRSQALST